MDATVETSKVIQKLRMDAPVNEHTRLGTEVPESLPPDAHFLMALPSMPVFQLVPSGEISNFMV